MRWEHSLCESLYQSFVSNIYWGNLPLGESLPPLHAICQQYHVGMSAVRAALQKLEDNGYIVTRQGKPAVVVFNSTALDNRRALLERRTAIGDTYDGISLLLADPLYASACRCPRETFCQARLLLEQPSSSKRSWRALINRTTALINLLMRPLNNPLLTDLFFEMRLFIRLPDCRIGNEQFFISRYFAQVDQFFEWVLTAPFPQREQLSQQLAETCMQMKREDLGYLDQLQDVGTVDYDAVSFHWSTSKRQSMYATVAFHLFNQIVLGIYPQGSLLPPVSALMEQYDISSTTARSACTMLAQLGVVHTINGVGTRVLSAQDIRPVLTDDNTLHKNLLSFLRAFQILTLTIRQTTVASFGQMDKATFSNLHLRLVQVIEKNPRYQVHIILLRVLVAHSPNHCTAMVYSELFELLSWGIYLLSQWAQDGRMQNGAACEYDAILEAARLAQPEALANALERLFLLEYHNCWSWALNLGLSPEEMPDPLHGGFSPEDSPAPDIT